MNGYGISHSVELIIVKSEADSGGRKNRLTLYLAKDLFRNLFSLNSGGVL